MNQRFHIFHTFTTTFKKSKKIEAHYTTLHTTLNKRTFLLTFLRFNTGVDTKLHIQ